MDRIKAIFTLATVGDIVGYKNGLWEFNKNGSDIINQFTKEYGSIDKLDINNQKKWIYSDDTVLHIATLKSIIDAINQLKGKNIHLTNDNIINNIYNFMIYEYIYCEKFMIDRAPGRQYMNAIEYYQNNKTAINVPYSGTAGGNGASIRSMILATITKKYLDNNIENLIKLAFYGAIITHNNGIGIIGGILTSCFTYFGLNNINPNQWGKKFLNDILPLVKNFINSLKNEYDKKHINRDLNNFENKFKIYLIERNIYTVVNPIFPKNFMDVKFRDEYYKKYSYDGWSGASGDDCVIIALDTLIYSGTDFSKLLYLSALHGGDSDSTATIACAFYGSLYGFLNCPKNLLTNYENNDYINNLINSLIFLL